MSTYFNISMIVIEINENCPFLPAIFGWVDFRNNGWKWVNAFILRLGYLKQLPAGYMADNVTSLFKTSDLFSILLFVVLDQHPITSFKICDFLLSTIADSSFVSEDADFLGLKWTSGWSRPWPQFRRNLAEWLVQWMMWAFVMPGT